MNVKSVLVLGSAGQIGAPLVQYLKKKGINVHDFDIEFGESDDLRCSPNPKLLELLDSSDFVFFLAFDVGGSHYLSENQEKFDFIENNMKIMTNTFEALSKSSTPFIYASSQMSNMDYSTYGLLKSIGERMTRSLKGLTVHFWNVYGPENDPKKFHAISDFVKMGIEEKRIVMRTDGLEFRDLLFVDDCCEALYQVMMRFDSIPRDFKLHIAKGEFTQIIDVANLVGNLTDARVIPAQSSDSLQKGVLNRPDLFVRSFWQPKTSLEEGIKRIIEHMQGPSRASLN